jgi:cephalosporin-C deacetylase-like acetyl esterase
MALLRLNTTVRAIPPLNDLGPRGPRCHLFQQIYHRHGRVGLKWQRFLMVNYNTDDFALVLMCTRLKSTCSSRTSKEPCSGYEYVGTDYHR